MKDFLLQFDDYNYKMLNDDVRRITTMMNKEVEQYNHAELKKTIMEQREQKKYQSRKLLDVYMIDAGSPKNKKKITSLSPPSRKESRRNLQTFEDSGSDEED